MIDKLLEFLAQFPKEKRNLILRFVDLFTWIMLVFDMVFGLPTFWLIVNLILCAIMLMMTIRLIQIGGWWWADDED